MKSLRWWSWAVAACIGTAQRPLRMGFYYTDLSSGQKNGALLARVDEISPLVWRRFTGNPTGIAPGVVLGHDRSVGGDWDAGGQEGSTCLQVRKTIYCYIMGDRRGWSTAHQTGHGHAIGLATSIDGGVRFTHWSNNSNAQCTATHTPFECCTQLGQGTCNAHHNPLIVANTSSPLSWNAGGGSCDITRKHGCVGTPYLIYDPEDIDPARRWKMWYAGSSNYGTTGMTKSVTQVAFASSPDGVTWTAANRGLPVFSMQGQRAIFPTGGNAYLVVKKFNGVYYMWFAPLDDKIGLATATSPEGPWHAYSGNPILSSARTKCPHPTSDDPLPFDVYRDSAQGPYRMIIGCMDRSNRVPCPGGATSHPVVPYYLTASEPNATAWTFDLKHSPLLNRSSRESFDFCSYASIRVMESYAGV